MSGASSNSATEIPIKKATLLAKVTQKENLGAEIFETLTNSLCRTCARPGSSIATGYADTNRIQKSIRPYAPTNVIPAKKRGSDHSDLKMGSRQSLRQTTLPMRDSAKKDRLRQKLARGVHRCQGDLGNLSSLPFHDLRSRTRYSFTDL